MCEFESIATSLPLLQSKNTTLLLSVFTDRRMGSLPSHESERSCLVWTDLPRHRLQPMAVFSKMWLIVHMKFMAQWNSVCAEEVVCFRAVHHCAKVRRWKPQSDQSPISIVQRLGTKTFSSKYVMGSITAFWCSLSFNVPRSQLPYLNTTWKNLNFVISIH